MPRGEAVADGAEAALAKFGIVLSKNRVARFFNEQASAGRLKVSATDAARFSGLLKRLDALPAQKPKRM
jgi:hypothetical protein